MPYTDFELITNKIPKESSDYWVPIVQELMDEWDYFDQASVELRRNLWPECARAYNCRRTLPEAQAMEWLDGSDLGETDIWDGINFLTDSVMNAQMPRDQSYLELLSYNEEDQGTLNDVRDLLMSIFRKSDIRGQYGAHVKQTLIYGSSAVSWRWNRVWSARRYGPAETLNRLKQDPNFDASQVNLENWSQEYKNYRFKKMVQNGPLVQAVDVYDFWMDPTAVFSGGNNFPIIQRYYLSEYDIKNAKDLDGQFKYRNTEGLTGVTLDTIYHKDPERLLITQEIGINPIAKRGADIRLVPVFMFHKQIRTFDADPGNPFVDCFFHVAMDDASKSGYRLIRVEENPNNNGSRGVFVDTYVDFMAGGYGVGAVEKSINAWEYKNIIAAINLNAMMAIAHPALAVIGGVIPDDHDLGVTPGSLTTIINKAGVGLNFVGPVNPVLSPTIIETNQKNEQWLAQKILAQMQASGAMVAQDPTKSIKSSKTATQINTETTSGSIIRDSYLEKMCIRSLEPMMQDIYDAARDWLDDPIIHFDKISPSNVSLGKMSKEQFDQDRKVILTGYHGLVNKAKEVEELKEALQVMTTGNALEVAPQLAPVMQKTLFKLLGRLGIKGLEQFEQDPIDMMLQNPMLMQRVVQNPQDAQAIMQIAQMIQQQQMMAQQQQQQGQPPGMPPGHGAPGRPPMLAPQGPPQHPPSMQSPQANPLIPRPPQDLSQQPGGGM